MSGPIVSPLLALDFDALSAGFRVDSGNRRRAYWTAFAGFGRLPGSLFGVGWLRWLRLWVLGPVGAVLLVGIVVICCLVAGVDLGLVWPSLVPAAVVAALLVGVAYQGLVPWYYVYVVPRRSDRVALFDDGNAFMTVKLCGQAEDGFWVLEAKNFVSTKHRGRLATHLMTTLLSRVEEAGNVRVVGRAQTRKLAQDYYRRDFGFVVGERRRIFYPG